MATPRPLTHVEIREVLTSCGLECDLALAGRVETYLRFLAKWNERMNLTGILAPLDVLKILLAESFLATVLVGNPKGPIVDVGSGAGFPGLAMAVYRPDLELILLEPRRKRAAFLAALRRELGLARVEVWSRTVEECSAKDFSKLPTVLTMRAVGAIAQVVEVGIRFFQGSGTVLLFSTTQAAERTMKDVKGVDWQVPKPIPWNPVHLILLGQARGDVPRETSKSNPHALS